MKNVRPYFLGIFIAFGLFGCKMIKAVKTVQSATLKQKNFNVTIPVDYPLSHIVLNVGINGSAKKYEFIFDTGAGGTVISQKLADMLGLKVVSSIKVTDGQGTANEKKIVLIPELDINELKFYNVGAIVTDYGQNSAISCLASDGIIGVNVISKCNWTMDYKEQKLTATDAPLNFPADAFRIPFTSGIPHINIQVNGTTVKDVFVDLGSNEPVSLQKQWLTKNPGLFPANSIYRQTGHTSVSFNGSGMDTLLFSNHDSLNLNGMKVYPVQTVFTSAPMSRIGNKFWDQYLVGIDYKTHEILLKRNIFPMADTTFKGMGFGMDKTDSGYVVSSVFENSPATLSGIKINDMVTEIDGKPIAQKFDNYCTFLNWQKTNLPERESISIKIKGRKDAIILNNTNYKPVKR